MLTLLLIGLIGYILYRLFKPRSNTIPARDQTGFNHGMGGGMGSLATGMILGYLLERALINQDQYNEWSNLGADELREKLTDEDLMSESDFDSLANQTNENHMAYGEPDLGSWNGNSSDYENVNDFTDNDLGGFDDSDF